ncbi:MAG: hypothetical protein LBN37_05605 [Bacteroidales bacterium]|jgi:hypothetical protein|nr:hypothetical protein [Bacteroidales bacterium]
MKTSNIIISSVFALAVIALVFIAFTFKNRYLSVERDGPYPGCIKQDFPNTGTVYVHAEDNPGFKPYSGDFGIRIVKGEHCMFAASDLSNFQLIPTDSGLVVISKHWRHPTAFVVLPALDRVEVLGREYVSVDGFVCDSLSAQAGINSSIYLYNCSISDLYLQSDRGEIFLQASSTVKSASVLLHDYARFSSVNIVYDAFSFDVDSTSSVTLIGRSIQSVLQNAK